MISSRVWGSFVEKPGFQNSLAQGTGFRGVRGSYICRSHTDHFINPFNATTEEIDMERGSDSLKDGTGADVVLASPVLPGGASCINASTQNVPSDRGALFMDEGGVTSSYGPDPSTRYKGVSVLCGRSQPSLCFCVLFLLRALTLPRGSSSPQPISSQHAFPWGYRASATRDLLPHSSPRCGCSALRASLQTLKASDTVNASPRSCLFLYRSGSL